MKLTDKYILGRFLKILAFSLLSFIMVVIIVDLIENVDKFIDYKAPVAIIVLYYIYYIPFVIILALPVAVLLSVMFTVGSLAKYHELEVMKATGLSLYRLAMPLLAAGFIISIAAILFTDFVMVPAEYKKDILKKEQIEKKSTQRDKINREVIKRAEDGWVVFAPVYNEDAGLGKSVTIEQIKNNQIVAHIKASAMIWSDSGWLLTGVSRRTFENGVETSFTTQDTLYGGFLTHTPEVMSHRQKKPRDTRFFELLQTIRLKQWMGQDIARDRVELYLKISFPFINFIIIILGVPLAANPRRSGGTVGFGLSIIISFIYFIFLRAGQSFGYNHKIPALLAATIGNIVFLAIGMVMFIKARK
jgi:lipopolysaccharide export system permease protein